MVQGLAFLSFTAWRQVSEPWLQKQSPRPGNIVRFDALAPRKEVLRSFLTPYANHEFVEQRTKLFHPFRKTKKMPIFASFQNLRLHLLFLEPFVRRKLKQWFINTHLTKIRVIFRIFFGILKLTNKASFFTILPNLCKIIILATFKILSFVEY